MGIDYWLLIIWIFCVFQGEKGDAFFIINSGQVKVTQLIEGEDQPRQIRVLNQVRPTGYIDWLAGYRLGDDDGYIDRR